MNRSLLFISILWIYFSSDCLTQHSSTWADAKLDTITSGNSDEFNPALQKNASLNGTGAYAWLVYEQHTDTSSDIVAKRFLVGGTWDTTTTLLATSSSSAQQTHPDVAGYSQMSSNVLVAWQKKTGSHWNIYYSFYLADSLHWQRPRALTTDSVDCCDVSVRSLLDTSFAIFWKQKNYVFYSIVGPRSHSVVDTAAVSNTDSVQYDIGGIIYYRSALVLFTQKNTAGGLSLWERVFLPDSSYKLPSLIATNGVSPLHPRYVQTLFIGQSLFTFDAYDGAMRDLWGSDYSGLSRLTTTPLVDERNCSVASFPIKTKLSTAALAAVFPGTESVFESDSTIILNPGNVAIASAGYNRAPVISGYGIPSGYRVAAVWESNRSGHTHIYSKNIYQWDGSVSRDSYEPAGFALSQNFPNPFNPTTTFRFSIPSSQMVSMKIFDILGREVTTLFDEQLNAGSYRIDWNAADQAGGTYFAVMKTPSRSETKKIILLK